MSIGQGKISKADLAKAFGGNSRLVDVFDAMQFIASAGTPVTSATPSNISIPIVINNQTYYLKLSTTE